MTLKDETPAGGRAGWRASEGAADAAAWAALGDAARKEGLSVVMPMFNLAGEAAANVLEVAGLFAIHGVPAQIVPVDDGSPDGTAKALAAAERDWNSRGAEARGGVRVESVACRRNGGKGAALRAGFDASRGGLVLLLDGDLDIKAKLAARFYEEMARTGADIVVGSKRHPESDVQYPWHRRLASFVYFTLVRIFVGLPVTDTQTGMKLFRRGVLGDALARMLVKTYAFDLELLAIAHSRGAKIAEAPVVIRFGSKFGALAPRTVRTMAMDSLAVFYRLKILKYYDRVEVPPRASAPPSVTVVVACPGPSAMLDECLAGVAAQTYDGEIETIVLPDGPFEPDAALAAAARVRVLPTGRVRPAEKRNAAIAAAKGEIVAFIDDDAYPEPEWIANAAKYFTVANIGAVGGPGVTPPGDGFLARAGGRVYENILVAGNYRYRYKAGGVRRDTDDFPSCNLFVRTGLLRKTGGYRTDFWPGEDTLLCKDIIDSGSRIVYDPWTVVNHHRRRLFAPHLRQLGRYAFHRGYFCRKFPSNSRHLSYFIPTAFVAYALACAAAALAPAAPHTAFWTAKLAFSAPLALYCAAVALTTFSPNPAMWLLTAAGVVASHLTYGTRFAAGLLARKAPCEFIGKDHPANAAKKQKKGKQ